MTENDIQYVRQLITDGIIGGRVLELGAGYGGDTCRNIIEKSGMMYSATDIIKSPLVDFVADFDDSTSVEGAFGVELFDSILILNVLEHVFDPVAILDNARSLLSKSGVIIVIAPAIWALHNYPIDCYRLLPNFYEQYASKRGMILNMDYFKYIGSGEGKVADNIDLNGNYQFPLPVKSKFQYWKSRLIHKIFNTFGRKMSFPSHVAIGVVFGKP